MNSSYSAISRLFSSRYATTTISRPKRHTSRPSPINATARNAPLAESFHSGNSAATDKIAIIQIDGVIMEGLMGYPHKQIEQAAEDDHVKAIVLRINSPGGSITASDDLHRRLRELREGDPEKKANPKPVVVSMASLAAFTSSLT